MADKGLAASDNTPPALAEQEAKGLLKVAMPTGLIQELVERARERGFANLSDAVRTVLASWARRDAVADAVSATPVSMLHPDRSIALGLTPAEER